MRTLATDADAGQIQRHKYHRPDPPVQKNIRGSHLQWMTMVVVVVALFRVAEIMGTIRETNKIFPKDVAVKTSGSSNGQSQHKTVTKPTQNRHKTDAEPSRGLS